METLLIPRIVGGRKAAIEQLVGPEQPTIPVDTLNWPKEYGTVAPTTLALAHDDKNIYLFFHVFSPAFRCVNEGAQVPVSEDCCVEAFLQPQKGGEYWNFEFNAACAINASHRLERPTPTRLTSEECESVFTEAWFFGPRNAEGKPADWSLFIEIPLTLLGLENCAPGTEIHGNFYSCASKAKIPYYQSWAPIKTPKPDFHRPEFFGRIILQ